jgi:protein TonB
MINKNRPSRTRALLSSLLLHATVFCLAVFPVKSTQFSFENSMLQFHFESENRRGERTKPSQVPKMAKELTPQKNHRTRESSPKAPQESVHASAQESAQDSTAGESAHDGSLNPTTSEMPVIIKRVQPAYPRLARELGVEGTVLVRIQIDTEGLVKSAHAETAVGFGLEEAAIEALKQFEFLPQKDKRGLPFEVSILHTVRFELN